MLVLSSGMIASTNVRTLLDQKVTKRRAYLTKNYFESLWKKEGLSNEKTIIIAKIINKDSQI